MGVGHLSIGIGQGPAQVYQQSPTIAQFGQILAQQKAKRDADRAYLANELASVQPAGLRNDADRSQFFNQYSQIKQQAIDADNIRDPLKRAMAIANVRQGMMGLSSYVDRSKKQAVEEAGFAKAYMANPDAWTDEAIKQYRDTKERAVADPSLLTDFTQLQRQVDGQKIDQEQQAREQALLKQQQWNNGVWSNIDVNGKKEAEVRYGRQVPKEILYEDALHKASSDAHFRQFLKQYAPEAYQTAPNSQAAQAMAVKKYIDSRADVSEYVKPEVKPGEQPVRFTAQQNWFMSHYGVPYNPNSANASGSAALTPAQILIQGNTSNNTPGMLQGNIDAMKRMTALTPKGQYGSSKIPDPIIDPSTGEHVFKFPPQVKKDEKAIESNKLVRAQYKNNPEKTGSILGFGGTALPIEQSPKWVAKLKPEVKVVKDAQEYRLNPSDPNAYTGQAAQMAADQNIKLPTLNQIQGGKGGRGTVVPNAPHTTPQVQLHTITDANGNTIQAYPKNGHWYNSKTNKPIE